ncbi:flagellar hook assembly protein FlgD [Paenibacillus sp. RC67]|uniref:flagellar hook assembly protein FlgD n=1 Tax=Paenibacillus sp. RC67 TaxID=3039392 RepID=UPI0024AE02C4|nr:flagellar hook assembly protein FlgD [Paenibacillus sp. RC67]
MSDSSVSTKNVWPYYAKTNVSNVAKETKSNDLGKDQFLKILIAQLKNQDPSQPLQDKEFIAQMAQFTSVEQLTNMSNEMKLLRQSLGFASGLIGKSITWNTTNEKGETVPKTGVVDSIVVKDGAQFAVVDKEKIALDQVTQIANPEEKQ